MTEIVLFPLPLVLFPGGRLPLRIFETRYLDMLKHCLKAGKGFGIVLIEQGAQVLKSPTQALPTIAQCGTYCTLIDFDQQANGVLQIVMEGQKKFLIKEQFENAERLMLAHVDFLEPEPEVEVPENKGYLTELLNSLLLHEAVQTLGIKIDNSLARDVGARLTELIPCGLGFKQKMLEVQDPLLRLSELEQALLRMQDSA